MKTTNTKNTGKPERQEATLDSRYGEIGIPAVAAAVQYKGEAAKPASEPTSVLAVRQPSPAVTDERFAPDLAA